MKATPEQQSELLRLQQADMRISRLEHLSKSHPLRDRLAELQGRADDLERFAIGIGADIEDRRRTIAGIEVKIEEVRSRGMAQKERLDSGKVGIRDMSAVEHEIAHINQRQDELESTLLDEMEAMEKAVAQREEALKQREIIQADEDKATTELTEILAPGRDEIVTLKTETAELRNSLPSAVVEEYDRLRTRQGPLVVLALQDGMVANSPVSLSAEEIDAAAAAPADELWVSDETGFIVARSAD